MVISVYDLSIAKTLVFYILKCNGLDIIASVHSSIFRLYLYFICLYVEKKLLSAWYIFMELDVKVSNTVSSLC